MIDIVLGEDHAAFADALATVLEDHGLKVLAVERTLHRVVEEVGTLRPDLLLVDRWFDDGDVFEVLADLQTASPGTAVVLLSADPARDTAQRALDAGARAFVHKTRGMSALLNALDRVEAGMVAVEIPPWWTGAREQRDARTRSPSTPLTDREYACLVLLVEGANTGQMAGRLGVEVNTVRSHVQSLLTKLGVHTRLEAAAHAVRDGLVEASQVERRA
jgi:two-component system nitrate/nitrite response regulator NarL